jgi:hypothetical protein
MAIRIVKYINDSVNNNLPAYTSEPHSPRATMINNSTVISTASE